MADTRVWRESRVVRSASSTISAVGRKRQSNRRTVAVAANRGRISTYSDRPEPPVVAAIEIFACARGSICRGTGSRDRYMNHTAALLSLATSIPSHQFDQKRVLSAALGVMSGRYSEFEAVESLFSNTGIRHRYAVKPMEWYLEPR